MRLKERIVSLLLALYPGTFRREYGAELTHLLMARPLGPSSIADVVWSGVRQRLRSPEPSMIFGFSTMMLIVTGFAWNIIDAPPYVGGALFSVLRPSEMTLPTLVVAPMKSELYVLALIACGWWTCLRQGARARPGLSAMNMSFIAGLPVMLAGVLMLTGLLGATVIGPGDTPTTFGQHGFTFTFYSSDRHVPSAWSVLVSPLFSLPLSWLWGNVGGWIGLKLSRRQARLA
jgi:hypothetical protein